jgi:hypothetical protein
MNFLEFLLILLVHLYNDCTETLFAQDTLPLYHLDMFNLLKTYITKHHFQKW